MKKVFLLSLGLIMGLGAFAQNRVMKNDKKAFTVDSRKTVVGTETTTQASSYAPKTAKSVIINRWEDMEDAETIETYYDLQSNSWCSNRMYQLPTGQVGIVATMSHENN